MTLSLSAAADGFVLGETSSITTLFRFSLLSTAIAEDGTCQLGVLEPGESCRYKGSSLTMSVPEAGSQVLFFELSGPGEPLSLKDASNPNNPNDPNVYNLHAVMLGRSYQIIRIYTAPEEFFSAELGSMGGAAILWAALFFFVNLARGLAGRRLCRGPFRLTKRAPDGVFFAVALRGCARVLPINNFSVERGENSRFRDR